ncbi:prenyltransferase/squalene oxidase repeat-containing protein [Neobacillus sp. PS3-34]|nr:prenyltransferase/squalene oxidase repeat-containing protein [Neobacillus sp. PS3-34]WML50635.1 prenyltransferase/squalene oxidase repeat-containing protein [Neobacillus sp. PS3-34]
MKQGLNGVAYGLIALDSANFKVPASAKWTKQKLVNELISKQNKDGGWTWDPSSTTSDIDTTAMVLTALAPHKGEAGVQEKIDQAVEYLSKQYHAGKIDNSSTAAQAVIALSSLNLDASDASFTKDGTSLISYLLTFQNADGGFDWQGGDVSDAFSTSQGFQAVVAYQLKVNGKGPLYQLPLSQATGKAGASSVATDSKPDDAAKKPTDRTDGKQGHKLPVTASEDYNMIALGSLMILAGFVALFIQRRKKASR